MMFRDMSFSGLLKTTLIINWAIPILCLPLVFIGWKINPDAVTFYQDTTLFGMTFKWGGEGLAGYLRALPVLLVIFIIGLIIQTTILWALGRFTPIGRIRLSSRVAR